MDCGVCQHAGRIGVFHQNVANMITQFTNILGSARINIAEMSNKSRSEVAYTVIDVDSPVSDEVVRSLQAVDGVYRVRKIH